jgi:xanthine dehydrogenase accessory factor
MMTAGVSRRAQELAAQGVAFVTATVVRTQRPTSAHAGNVALVRGDGTIEGFVGGACAEHSVRVYSLAAIETGEAVLLRIVPFAGESPTRNVVETAGEEVSKEEGAVTVQNPCLSGGAIEVFIEPVLPAPRVLVVGDTPIAGAVRRLGAELGLDIVDVQDGLPEPAAGDLGLVVATHGRDELHTLRRGLESGVAYVGLVASRTRGAGVIAELRGDGVSDQLLSLIDSPAGIDIGARTPAEVAVSILAKIVAVRRQNRGGALGGATARAAASAKPTVAVDPICGMTIAVVAGTPSVEHDGKTVHFCCEGCKARFEAEHTHAIAAP